MTHWIPFKERLPVAAGFYRIKHRFKGEISIFMSELGKASFGASAANGFIYMYHNAAWWDQHGPVTHWRLMSPGEIYTFHDEYLKVNGLIGLHNLRSFNNLAINPRLEIL